MKKKSPRGIPDFSRQTTRPKDGGTHDVPTPQRSTAPTAPKPPRIKPQGTSAKSGQRGK